MTEAFLWGLVGGSSLVVGAVIVFRRKLAERTLGLVLGFGAGVLLSAVSFELVTESLSVAGAEGGAALGFFAGAIVFYLGDSLIARMNRGGGEQGSNGLSIVLGTVLDGIPESAVLGLTLLQTGDIGISMLIAVFVSNLPESIGATTDLLDSGWSRTRVLVMWVSVAVVSAVSAAAGFAFLDGASERTLAFVLAFAAGAILTMLSTSMIPEAFEEAKRPVGLATTLGFAVSLAISLWAE